ncbi:YciI-like protein [uncultured Sphingomonas sp.]|uniref:YciI-like protein n=1 Tax=uncultured Sphingomonas sp. TaxID=158754 RepID=UPI0025CE8D64|nr:YciI-like protein [uncultured Sphingomonas sp.]
MRHFLLFYDVASDYLERRARFRDVHLAYAVAAVARGELVLGGALADPADQAVLLFAGGDPYVTEGLVQAWRVREWVTVIGKDAAQPIDRPA